MDTQKIILIAAFVLTSVMLWQSWDRHIHPDKYPNLTESSQIKQDINKDINKETKAEDKPLIPTSNNSEAIDPPVVAVNLNDIVRVTTDVFDVEISTQGADIQKVSLLKYPVDINYDKNPVVIMDNSQSKYFVSQSGILSKNKKEYTPDHRTIYQIDKKEYNLAGKKQLEVTFTWLSADKKISLEKTYVFRKGDYKIDLKQKVINNLTENYQGHFYRQLQRDNISAKSMFIYTYTGGMLYRDGGGFEKYSFDDMDDEALNRSMKNGWIAFIQHYFLVSWIPDANNIEHYYSRKIQKENDKNRYIVGLTSAEFSIKPGESYNHEDALFVGPKLQNRLKEISANLDDTVDFGFLSVIAHPIFWLLENIHKFVGNWGWSIILLTLVIKLLFYKLSEYSYRSMAEMRKLTPKLKALQEQHKDNPQAKNEAMMKMYKEEKINPLGGCLPVIAQIPVFISLYWVLLESVELRQADFIFWLNNLSAPDPYYVLPLIMGITMFIQQRLNPAPTDAIQAKVMQTLPFIFTIFFAFFPSGLVLYWVTNNILSITQQWYITKQIEKQP